MIGIFNMWEYINHFDNTYRKRKSISKVIITHLKLVFAYMMFL